MRIAFLALATTLVLAGAMTSLAEAGGGRIISARRAPGLPWHNAYSHTMYGTPVALVVPPTAEFQSNYGWGVSGTRVSRIYHQFGRPYPGDGYYGGEFLPTPHWPSDTTQDGVYYIRGPWGTQR